MIKGKTLHIFVRFGGLDLKNQKGYTREQKSFHAPPAPKGFYAMPKVAQELFLIGSLRYQPGILPKSPEFPLEEHNIPPEHREELIREYQIKADAFDYDKHSERVKQIKSEIRKEFTKKKGDIWHHLEDYSQQSEVIARHGSWIKTSIAEWERAFSRMSLKVRNNDCTGRSVDSINESTGIVGGYSKDHCEVFFDEKV